MDVSFVETDDKMAPDVWSVRPWSFRSLVGHGHPDFASFHQQDSHHYFTHLLDVMDRSEKADRCRLSDAAEVSSS